MALTFFIIGLVLFVIGILQIFHLDSGKIKNETDKDEYITSMFHIVTYFKTSKNLYKDHKDHYMYDILYLFSELADMKDFKKS